MNNLSIIIPVRNKELWRLNEVVKRLKSDLIREIIIVDYLSDEPIKLSGEKIKVIRYDRKGPWNKAHAINIGLKSSSGKYIMTLDADIIIKEGFFDKLLLEENTYCYSGDVRRIESKHISEDFEYMWEINSFPWINASSYSKAMYGLANGGLQLYPRRLLEEWNGIDENLVYSGGMDNITNLMAKKLGMRVVQLPIKLIHLEHSNRKVQNYPAEEQTLAHYLTSHRGEYLNNWINNPIKNEYYGSMEGPCYSTYLSQLQVFNDNKELIEKDVLADQNKDKKIMIAVINNSEFLPARFTDSLFKMYIETTKTYPKTNIVNIKACQVNHMRNLAIIKAMGEGYDYLIQLDTDHKYDPDTITKLMSHNKDFVTVPTKQRINPFPPTQYWKLMSPLKQEGNFVFLNGDEPLLKIECSGPVAMLMKTEKLRKLDFPYYEIDYTNGFENTVGGDVVFCRQLKEKGFELFVDGSINCPHFVKSQINSYGENPTLSFDDGKM